jgi:hypothetical protein
MGYFGILLMLTPVIWLVEFIRNAWYESNAGAMGSLWWPILSVVLFFVGIFALSGFDRLNLLESDCPCCGTHATRTFYSYFASGCGRCIGYLRADGDRVREESLDAVADSIAYSVYGKRYEPAARRDQRGRLNFQMPQICAICGDTEIAETKEVDVTSPPSSSGPSWLGMAIVATSSGSTRRRMGLRYDGTVKSSGSSSTTDEDQRREQFANVRVPVCSKHTGVTTKPLKCSSMTLEFASYRYYKEFLALNRIDAPETKS